MQLARFLNKVFKKNGFILIDANSNNYIIGKPNKNPIKLKILKKTIISSCKKGNTIIALSRTCKKLLVLEGIPEKKIIVAPNGVDIWWNDQETKDQNIIRDLNKSRFMLYVSHFHRYKNHINLINAYSKLPKRIVEDYSLVLVGRFHDKNYMKDIYKLIEYKKNEKKYTNFLFSH